MPRQKSQPGLGRIRSAESGNVWQAAARAQLARLRPPRQDAGAVLGKAHYPSRQTGRQQS